MSKIKLSNSSMNRFSQCPRSYKYHYIDKLVSKYKSGALYFGSALDVAISDLLTNKNLDQAKEVFEKQWTVQADNSYLNIELAKNEGIVYAKSDFDSDLLSKADWAKLYFTAKELGIEESPMTAKFRILSEKESKGWENLESSDRILYNYMNWLCLRQKGLLMLEAYNQKILPKIKRVISLQQKVSLIAEDGDEISGFIDVLAEWEDGSIVVLDNKTSSIDYELDSVKTSQQLAIYQMLLENDGVHTDKAGYLVLKKKLNKDITKVCKSCGFKAESGSQHKTCHNEIENEKGKKVRCNGTWDKTVIFNVDTQIIVDKVDENMKDLVMESINDINASIKTNIFPRNLGNCFQFGSPCSFYNKCHRGSEKDLIKLEDK